MSNTTNRVPRGGTPSECGGRVSDVIVGQTMCDRLCVVCHIGTSYARPSDWWLARRWRRRGIRLSPRPFFPGLLPVFYAGRRHVHVNVGDRTDWLQRGVRAYGSKYCFPRRCPSPDEENNKIGRCVHTWKRVYRGRLPVHYRVWNPVFGSFFTYYNARTFCPRPGTVAVHACSSNTMTTTTTTTTTGRAKRIRQNRNRKHYLTKTSFHRNPLSIYRRIIHIIWYCRINRTRLIYRKKRRCFFFSLRTHDDDIFDKLVWSVRADAAAAAAKRVPRIVVCVCVYTARLHYFYLSHTN